MLSNYLHENSHGLILARSRKNGEILASKKPNWPNNFTKKPTTLGNEACTLFILKKSSSQPSQTLETYQSTTISPAATGEKKPI